jgi:hypothetical protein
MTSVRRTAIARLRVQRVLRRRTLGGRISAALA